MSKADREHLDSYREQTRIKHEIVQKYLPAFYNILKGTNKNLLYIDAFAGRGTYRDEASGDDYPGSPLRALDVIAGNKALREKVGTIFIESDAVNFAQLKPCIENYYENHKDMREPQVVRGRFEDVVGGLLDELEEKRKSIAPTFLFVDPCGIAGANLRTIERLMKAESCEVFVFFNIDGARRVAGLEKVSQTLVSLFGSAQEADEVVEMVRSSGAPNESEKILIGKYRDALRKHLNVEYITAFRIEAENRQTASHYLVHATKHRLGFKIMKDIMWPLGVTPEGKGGLQMLQAGDLGIYDLFMTDWGKVRDTILDELASGSRTVGQLCDDLACRPEDMVAATAYKEALKELESENKIVVLDKAGKKPCPANERRKRKGKVTLADDYFVSLPQ
jgi:three-Cys-motif partner protein